MSILRLVAVAAFLFASTSFASPCDKDLMASEARLSENVARLSHLYPIPEYAEKTVYKYESVSARVSESRRYIWVDMITQSNTTETILQLIEGQASGTTRLGYSYSVKDKVLTLTNGVQTFHIVANSDFGPGFNVKNEKTGGELQYSTYALLERDSDPLRRFGYTYFEASEIEAALDLTLSVQGRDPQLSGIAFESIADFSATMDRHLVSGLYSGLPLTKLPSKIARLLRKAAQKQIIIGDYDYLVNKVSEKQLKKFGETGDWVSLADDERVWWVKNSARGEDIRIRSFSKRSRSIQPMGSLSISNGQIYPSADWTAEGHGIVYALLLVFRDTGLE